MWYAIQVVTGNERQTVAMCRKIIKDSVIIELFCPETEVMKRYHGTWHKEKKAMFPGYLFVITDNPEELYLEFMQVPKLTKLLGTDKIPVELSEDEVQFLEHILNSEYVAKMSVGILEGDKLIVRSGPLRGMEGMVKKINRHKRNAVVMVEMLGRRIEVTLGLEVVEKINQARKELDDRKKQ